MGNLMNTLRSNTLAQAVVSLLFGLLLLVWPGATIVTVIYLLAAGLAISGIASLFSYFRDKSDRYRNGSVLTVGIFYLIWRWWCSSSRTHRLGGGHCAGGGAGAVRRGKPGAGA